MSVSDGAATSARKNDELERVNANSACFRWKLRNFSGLDRSLDLSLPSKEFTATGYYVNWRMKLYPNGREPNENDASMIVGVEYSTSSEVTATFGISVVDGDGEVMEDLKLEKENVKLVNDTSVHYPRYVDAGLYSLKLRRSDVENPKNGILEDDCLTISFEVTYSDPLVVPAISKKKDVEYWQEKKLKEFEKLLDEFSDVTFNVEGIKKIRAHKAILAMHSPVFKTMFLQEKERNLFPIFNIEYAVLIELFRFMYTGAIGNIDKVASDLVVAAEKYCVHPLKALCYEKALSSNVNIDNAVDWFPAVDACNEARHK